MDLSRMLQTFLRVLAVAAVVAAVLAVAGGLGATALGGGGRTAFGLLVGGTLTGFASHMAWGAIVAALIAVAEQFFLALGLDQRLRGRSSPGGDAEDRTPH